MRSRREESLIKLIISLAGGNENDGACSPGDKAKALLAVQSISFRGLKLVESFVFLFLCSVLFKTRITKGYFDRQARIERTPTPFRFRGPRASWSVSKRRPGGSEILFFSGLIVAFQKKGRKKYQQ